MVDPDRDTPASVRFRAWCVCVWIRCALSVLDLECEQLLGGRDLYSHDDEYLSEWKLVVDIGSSHDP